VLTDEERAELTRLVRSKLTSVRPAQRARVVLLASQGLQNIEIAAQLGVGRVQVAR
jgi:DNA-directed RNA polymerase specialized sigma24 family protein